MNNHRDTAAMRAFFSAMESAISDTLPTQEESMELSTSELYLILTALTFVGYIETAAKIKQFLMSQDEKTFLLHLVPEQREEEH